MKISFIIPTLNEEKRISRAIGQFKALDGFADYEVIVADGNSTDRTKALAQEAGAKVYTDASEKKTIAKGRNLGARMAAGDVLIFCDADTLLEDPRSLIARIGTSFADKRVVAALPRLEVFPGERIWKDRLFHGFFNSLIKFSFFVHAPFAYGQCQIIRASAFREVGGYNEEQVHAEDSALFKKLGKIGKLVFLSDERVLESPRRYRKIGYINLIRTSLISVIGQAIFKRNILKKWERID